MSIFQGKRDPMGQAAAALERLTRKIETGGGAVDYVFDPSEGITLADIVDLLRAVGVGATSDQYLDDNFPANLKRHFRPVAQQSPRQSAGDDHDNCKKRVGRSS